MLGIDFLYDNYLQLEDYLRTGGVIMLPLVLVSLAMWLLIMDRAFFFRRLRRKTMSFASAWELLRANRSPDPGQHSPDPGQHSPDPGQHSPDPGQ